ncbi:NAD-dependent epimerase/dehydratase family protein [Gemmobacter serpentinus]|uniref:NAD-dependent epimerase/dehydratase family protein n=1 Tax=Gemmobacter serpentinus TaxID=2652247 RepID=UPI00124C394F|nr:NAD-dependent epimerase/dehydratase family protein [Gemmobacter serpentinus]
MAEAVLLTGARGFVGRAVLAELVAQGLPVHAVSRQGHGPALPGVTWHQADLLQADDRAALIRAAPAPRLIHCAWYVEHGRFWTAPENRDWHLASVDLVRLFRARGGGRVIGLGTCAEYDALSEVPWDESRPLAPATPYGQAKAALYDDLSAICGQDLVWARLFHLFGPGEDPRRLIPGLIADLREGRVAEVRAAGLLRDYASTHHIARSLVALLDSPASGPVDLGAGQPRSLGQLAQTLGDLLGRPELVRLSHNPGPADPPAMTPRLTKLHAAIGPVTEQPEQALARLLLDQPLRAR